MSVAVGFVLHFAFFVPLAGGTAGLKQGDALR
jgi:hypothetical protein